MASILNATTTSGLVTSADNSGSLQLATNNGTTAMTITTGQNVGIGTSSPATNLTVKGTSGIAAERDIDTDRMIVTFNDITNYANASGAGNYNNWTFTQSNNSGSNERMRIDSSGNVIMGHTAYDYSVNGFGFGAGNAYSYFTRTSGFALGVNRKTTTGDLMAWWYNQSGVGTVSTNGSSTSYNTTLS